MLSIYLSGCVCVWCCRGNVEEEVELKELYDSMTSNNSYGSIVLSTCIAFHL